MFRNTAHVYDLVYEFSGTDHAAESTALAWQVQTRAPSAQTLLDVACGTGGHLVYLKDHFEVMGVDLDPNMLVEARRRLPNVEFVEADMRTFDLGRQFDAVVCLFSSVGYMPDRAALSEAITCMARHLTPNGVLIVDGWVLPEAWKEPGTVHAVSGQADGIAVARVGRSKRQGDKSILELHHLVATADALEHLVDHHKLTSAFTGWKRCATSRQRWPCAIAGASQRSRGERPLRSASRPTSTRRAPSTRLP